MGVVQLVGASNQSAVKASLAHAGLVPTQKKDSRPIRIERKCNSHDALMRVRAKLLHVRILRAIEGVRVRSTQVRSEHFQELDLRNDFRLVAVPNPAEPFV